MYAPFFPRLQAGALALGLIVVTGAAFAAETPPPTPPPAVVAAAQAKPVSVTLSAEEQQMLIALLDLAVKAGGLQVAGVADVIAKKVIEAQKAAGTPLPTIPPAGGK